MNLLIFTRVKKCISLRIVKLFAYGMTVLFPILAKSEWNVDFSRRQDQMRSPQSVSVGIQDAMGGKAEDKNFLDRVFDTVVPTQEIVILNTEQGFVPSTVRVKEGAQYRLIVVNVNEKARNVSFVLDSFSEHHATFFGKLKSFNISPKREGVYTFLSPETSAQGRLVVLPATGGASPLTTPLETRAPASE